MGSGQLGQHTDMFARRRASGKITSPSTLMTGPAPVDLIITFKGATHSLSKHQTSEDARKAEAEYTHLLNTLNGVDLKATGRRGDKKGQLLVLIWAPPRKVAELLHKQSRADFLLGLPSTLPAHARDYTTSPLSHADRLRLVHDYVTSLNSEGGLGINPGVPRWPHVESILALHDHDFNRELITAWTRRRIGFNIGFSELNKIKEEFGEALALYFAFLSSYTLALFFPSAAGILFWAFSAPYSPWYSAILCIWSICWVEWWRIREKMLSVRWGTLGSFRVEKLRPEVRGQDGQPAEFAWWKREIRMICSLPIIIFFAGILAALLTLIFVFEVFVAELYQGPLHEYISLAPTILVAALVPRVLALYQTFASKMTDWENHAHKSSHDASLTIKTFALSAIVTHLGLALLAFVYVPFGQAVMVVVQDFIVHMTQSEDGAPVKALFDSNILKAQSRIDQSRLQKQMFANAVTSQIIDTLVEVVLPYVMRGVNDVRNGKPLPSFRGHKKVAVENEKDEAKEERQLLEVVRHDVTLSEYTLFGDYDEMITQFGYVTLWSTIWPLTPLMALVNNWFELRSDAFKIMTHNRKPFPVRVDTIGPWLDAMASISWLGALSNSALIYLFRPQDNTSSSGVISDHEGRLNLRIAWHSVIIPLLLITLSSSHAYLLMRSVVRHVMVRAFWRGSEEEKMLQRDRDEVNSFYLEKAHQNEISDLTVAQLTQGFQNGADPKIRWELDEGIEELCQSAKTS